MWLLFVPNMYAGLWKGKEQIIFRTLITWPKLLKRNQQLPVEQLALPRIEWMQTTAMKVVKSSLYRAVLFCCVIIMAFTVSGFNCKTSFYWLSEPITHGLLLGGYSTPAISVLSERERFVLADNENFLIYPLTMNRNEAGKVFKLIWSQNTRIR